jgi:hypothetical protein
MRKVTCVLCLLAVFLAGTAGAGEYLFDFGTADSPVEPGFVRVTEKDAYNDKTGYGWEPGITLFSRSDNFSSQCDSLSLTPLLCDHVTGGKGGCYNWDKTYTFKVNLPEGKYSATLLMGKVLETDAATINRPPFWYRGYEVKANGQVLLKTETAWEKHLKEFYRDNEGDFLPGDSFFDKYLKKLYKTVDFECDGGELKIEASTICPFTALLIYPREEQGKLRRQVEDLFILARLHLDGKYQEKQPEFEPLTQAASAAGTENGMLLFARPGTELHPRARPTEKELGRPAGVVATPGEKATLEVALLPLTELREAAITVGEFKQADGAKLAVTPQVWRSHYYAFATVQSGEFYSIRPWYAFPYKPENLPALVTRPLTVYLDVPADAAPGDYFADLTVATADGKTGAMKLAVKVLPFALQKDETTFGMYLGGVPSTHLRFVYFNFRDQDEDRMCELGRVMTDHILSEMKDAGFNTVATEWTGRYMKINDQGEPVIEEKQWKFWQEYMPIYMKYFGKTPMPAYGIGHSGLVSDWSVKGFWSREVDEWKKTGITPESAANMEKLVTFFYNEVRKQGWPEILMYVQDEMGNYGTNGGKMAAERAKLFRQVADKVGFRTCASMLGPVEHEQVPFLHISIPNGGFPINEENLKMIRDKGSELWFYNIGANRFTYGYYMYKTKAKGRLQWSFGGPHRYLSQAPFVPSLGSFVYTTVFDSELNLARRWDVEQMRRGIQDYYYCLTLDKTIAENENSADPKVAAAVEKAKALREYLLNGIQVSLEHEGESFVKAGLWSDQTCQRLRWRLAMAIEGILSAK